MLMKAKLYLSFCLLFLAVLVVGCQKTTIVKLTPMPITPDSKIVCIYFDDAFLNQYEVALPILIENNFRATFGVITDHIGEGYDLMEYMDAGHLETLAAYGMDIASHTKTHNHIRTLSDAQLREELSESRQHLIDMGFDVPTMVYPYYEWDDRIIEYTIEAGYTCARGGWTQDRVYDRTTTDVKARYHVAAWQISNQDMDAFKAIINQATSTNVVSLVYHFISDTGPQDTSTSVADFKAQMAFLKSAGYTVVCLPDLFK
jgi:peptidoglycan/xylan/chitin deacetylase (PgdA/CDA1 family)